MNYPPLAVKPPNEARIAEKYALVEFRTYGNKLPAGCKDGPVYVFSLRLTTRTNYSSGTRHGWETLWQYSVLQRARLFEGGKVIRELTYGGTDNVIRDVALLSEQRRHGAYTEKNSRGERSVTGQYRHDKMHGRWRFYDRGTLRESHRFNQGRLHGISYYYSEHVEKTKQITYKNDKRRGWAYTFKDGKQHGYAHFIRCGQMTVWHNFTHDKRDPFLEIFKRLPRVHTRLRYSILVRATKGGTLPLQEVLDPWLLEELV